MDYPRWIDYPNSATPPAWTADLLGAVAAAAESIDSRSNNGLTSDKVLLQLRPALERLGFHVEASKRHVDKVRRPVLFGEQGRERVAYEADAVHDSLGVLLEVEAGRGAMGNAVYRDLVRTSLIVGARFLALGVMLDHRYSAKGLTHSYRDTKELLDAVYASGRLGLPFEGLLLFGYEQDATCAPPRGRSSADSAPFRADALVAVYRGCRIAVRSRNGCRYGAIAATDR